jgi:hypothetical protein
MKLSPPLLAIYFFCAFLGGCGTVSPSGCLKTSLVSNLSKTPLFPVLKDDNRTVAISSFKGKCVNPSDDLPGEKGDISISMALTMPEAQQKKGRVRKIAFPIFVALLDEEDEVLDRHDEEIVVTISDHSLSHIHKTTYHLPEEIDVDSQSHYILVGFNRPVRVMGASAPQFSRVKVKKKLSPKKVQKRRAKGKKKRKGKKKSLYKKRSKKCSR